MVSKADREKQDALERKMKMATKSLKDVDTIYEAIAFIWLFRQRELKNVIIIIQTAIIIFFAARYTSLFVDIYKIIKGFFK